MVKPRNSVRIIKSDSATPTARTIERLSANMATQIRIGHRIVSLTSVRLLQVQGNLRAMSKGLSISPPPGSQVPKRHPKAPPEGTLLGSHNQDCFGCGASHPTGLHLTAYAGSDMTITAKFTVSEHHQGAPGLAHGGLLSCAFDEALGKLMWLIREPAVTGKLETIFLLPVQVGKTLYIKAEIFGQDGRKVYCRAEGRIDSETGPIAVEAAAIYITVPLEHFVNNAPEGFREALFGINGKTPELEINP